MSPFIRELFNVPNTLSLLRLAATPMLALVWFGLDWKIAVLIVGIVVGITDLVDGILARKLKQMTDLGALLDQLGDLVFESTVLLMGVLSGAIWMGWLMMYLFREFTVTILRTYVYSRGGTLPSTWMGKAKSACIQWAFFPLFLGVIFNEMPALADLHIAGLTPGWIAVHSGLLSIITGILVGLLAGWQYLKAFAAFYEKKSTISEP